MFDSHCHLQDAQFDSDREQTFAEANTKGVTHFLVPATDPASFASTMALTESHSTAFGALGVHPHSANEWGPEVKERIRESFEKNDKIVAIGEIGLDYHYDFAPRDVQRLAFAQQIELAIELNKPIVIHTRESEEDVFRIVEEHYGSLPSDAARGQFHCFSAGQKWMHRAIDLGFHVSFTGNITFKKSTLADVVRETPLDRLLIETDSPYLAPAPYRGKRNSPAYLPFIAEKVAELKQLDISTIMHQTFANTLKLFRIPGQSAPIARTLLLAVVLLLSFAVTSQAQRPAGAVPPDSVLTNDRRRAEELRKKQEEELAKEAEQHRQDSIREAGKEQEDAMAKAREQVRQDSIRAAKKIQEEADYAAFMQTPQPWRAIGIGGGIGIGSMQMDVNKSQVSATSVFAWSVQASTAITRRLDFEISYSHMNVGDNFPQDSVWNFGPGASAAPKPPQFAKGRETHLITGENIGISWTSFDFRYVITKPSSAVSFYLGVGFSHLLMSSQQRYHVMLDSVTTSPIEQTYEQDWSRNALELIFGMRHDFELGHGLTVEPFAQIAAYGVFQGTQQDKAFVFVPTRNQIIMTHLKAGVTLYYGWFGVPRQ